MLERLQQNINTQLGDLNCQIKKVEKKVDEKV